MEDETFLLIDEEEKRQKMESSCGHHQAVQEVFDSSSLPRENK